MTSGEHTGPSTSFFSIEKKEERKPKLKSLGFTSLASGNGNDYDIEDWQEICRCCDKPLFEKNPCASCVVYDFVRGYDSVTSNVNSDNGGAPECETNSSQIASFSNNNNGNGNSPQCERGVHPPAKTFTLRGSDSRQPAEPKIVITEDGSLPLLWWELIRQIKSGKDQLTPLIVEYILMNPYGGITHERIASYCFSKLGRKVDRSTISKRIKKLKEIGVVEEVGRWNYKVSKQFVNIYYSEVKPECEIFAPRGVEPDKSWQIRIHGFQRAFKVVKSLGEDVNFHEILNPLTLNKLRLNGWKLRRRIKRSGSNDSYEFWHYDYGRVAIEVYKRKIIVKPAEKMSYCMSLKQFKERYVDGASDPDEDVKDYCIEAVKTFLRDLSDAYGRELIHIDEGWAGEKRGKGKSSKFRSVNRPEYAIFNLKDSTLYRVINEKGKFYIPELGMYLDGSLGGTPEIEFENTEDSKSSDNIIAFLKGFDVLSDPDVARGLKTIGAVGQIPEHSLAVMWQGGLSTQNVSNLISEAIKNLEEKIEKTTSELEEIKRIKREMSEIKRALNETKNTIESLQRSMVKVLQDSISQLNTRYIQEVTQVVNTLAVMWNRLDKLEASINGLKSE